MKRSAVCWLLLLAAVLLVGTAGYGLLFHFDNKYEAALPGGYGYNVLQEDVDTVAFLVDGWEYYPGELLEPKDFASGIVPEAYTYIGQYSNFSEQLGTPYGVATYRIILAAGARQLELALYLPEVLCAARVYVDGVLIGEQGSISPYAPRVMDGVYSIAVKGNTEIIIQCANYTHYYSGMYFPPAIGSIRAVANMRELRLVVYSLLCFTSLAIALIYLVQWLLGRDRPTRWMGLLSLAFAVRLTYVFIRGFGVPSVRPLYALEDVSGNLVLLCAVLLAGELAGNAERWFHRRVAVPAAVGLCLFTAIFPLFILPYAPLFINTYGLILFIWKGLAGLYLLFCHRYYRDTPLRCYQLCAAGLYGLSLVLSVVSANRFEPICGAWLEEYGGFALVVGFAASMIRRGALLSRENRRLTEHLQQEVDRKTETMDLLLSERRELLANLLHDIKNPLAALFSYAELMRSDGVELDQETAAYLDALTDRAAVVGDRLEQLRDFSRGERGLHELESICLNDFLSAFYKNNQPDLELSGLRFVLKTPLARLVVRGNRERLWSVLENLCYNAAAFTPEDGSVTLALSREKDHACIQVRDTGPGIAAEDLPHVFERGFSRRAGGEGLGLHIARGIVLEHGGTIQVLSGPEGGACFEILLPLQL